jgi:hypothetical protein
VNRKKHVYEERLAELDAKLRVEVTKDRDVK